MKAIPSETHQPAGFPPIPVLKKLLLIRNFESKLLSLFHSGVLNGTTHTCIGQEVVSVAAISLLKEGDQVFSNHRGHGHYLARYDDPEGLMAEIMGKEGAICDGVGGSQHLRRDGFLSTGVQGESLPVSVGVALDMKLHKPGAVCMPFIGDGTWGQGAVYEALNLASLWQVPICVIVENNRIAQTTRIKEHMAGDISGRCRAFGVAHEFISTNDVETARILLAPLIEKVRDGGGPLVVEFLTDRLSSHSKGDDTRPEEELSELHDRDWHSLYRALDPDLFEQLDSESREMIEEMTNSLLTRRPSEWDPLPPTKRQSACLDLSPDRPGELVVENLNRALHLVMEDESVFFLGEDIADPYGGAFKAGRGLSTRFPGRVLSTPISELGFTGVANGLALSGRVPIVEFMFGDFALLAYDQIVNFAAKSPSMYGERRRHTVLFRIPVGGRRGYGPTHSQSVQKHFLGIPDLDLYETSPLHDNTKLIPLILSSGTPSILFESKSLYGWPVSTGDRVDDLYHFSSSENGFFARAFVSDQPDLTIVTTGSMFPDCLGAARKLFFEHEIDSQIIVLARIYPFDLDWLGHTTTSRAVFLVEEGSVECGWTSGLSRELRELERSGINVQTIGSVHSIIPSSKHLEAGVIPGADQIAARILSDLHS